MQLYRTYLAARRGLWFVPLSCMLAGLALAVGTTLTDRHNGYALVSTRWTGTADDVRVALSTFASSLITLTGLVLTMTLVVVQLAMGQFSPRIVRSLLENHPSQLVIGVFGATFVQSVVTLRQVDADRPNAVPGVSVLVTYALMLSCLVALVLYIHKVGKALRVSSLIEIVGQRSRELVDDLYPGERGEGPTSLGDVIVCHEPGVLLKIDESALIEEARRADCVIELVPTLGDFVPGGAPLFRIRGDATRVDGKRLVRLIVLGNEREMHNDLPYAVRLLVDIATRALSPSTNDATTAIQAIHRLHDLLRQLATRTFPDVNRLDEDGRVRLVITRLDWDGYVRLAFDEIRLYGASSVQIPRRLREAIEDIKTVAPPERQRALDRQLELLGAAAERELPSHDEAALALTPDPQGLGSGADLIAPRSNGSAERPIRR